MPDGHMTNEPIPGFDNLPGFDDLLNNIQNAHVEVSSETNSPTSDGREPSNSPTEFDPKIHSSNPDGSPKLTKTGKLRLKPGRRSGSQASERLNLPEQREPDFTPRESELGRQYCGLFLGAGGGALGPDFLPEDDKERVNLEHTFSEWAKRTGQDDLPPNLALVASLSMYTIAKLAKPTVSQRAIFLGQVVFGNAKTGIMKIGAWFNSRAYGLRKNDAGKASNWFSRPTRRANAGT